MMNSIYALIDPQTGEVRYIGVTCKALPKRLHEHLYYASKGGKTHRCCWIRSLLKEDSCPVILLLEETEDRVRECWWIAYYRSFGADLVNGTSGGDGGSPTAEVRRKIGAANKGRKWTDEQREKLLAKRSGRQLSSEHKEKIRNIHTGMRHCEETRKLISTIQIGRIASPETRAKMSKSAKEYIKTHPGCRCRTHSEIARARLSQSMKAYWEQKKTIDER